MKANRALGLAALVLLGLSVWTYRASVGRAERFERGQKLLPQLNADAVGEILITRGEATVHLRRSSDRFVVVDANGYPARNEEVNRFLERILAIALEKEVGRGEALEAELGLTAGSGEERTEVELRDASAQPMVGFVVGGGFEGGGSYVRRSDVPDAAIYLTQRTVFLNASPDDFLDKEILDVPRDQVLAIRGADWELAGEGGTLLLSDLPAGRSASPKLDQVKTVGTGVRFVKHLLADHPEVQGLEFDDAVEIDLADGSGYRLAVAGRDGRHFLRVQAYHRAGRLELAVDAPEEEVRQTADVLARADEVREFNHFHGSWVYEVSESVAEKVRFRRSDLIN